MATSSKEEVCRQEGQENRRQCLKWSGKDEDDLDSAVRMPDDAVGSIHEDDFTLFRRVRGGG